MAPEKARQCAAAARGNRIVLSAHAPYYINLCSDERQKVAASKKRILDTARILEGAGGGRVVVHSGYYGKLDRKKAYEIVKDGCLDVLGQMKKEGIKNAVIAPETTGKASAFGSLEELYGLAADIGFERFKPTVDFAHLHARSNGALKTGKDFDRIFEIVKGFVGRAGLQQLHCHFSGIQFSAKGELRHLTIDAKSPDFSLLAQSLAENNCSGTVISESPSIEKDALLMKRAYERAQGRI
jgi:deoxyribonuclease-4